jgi:zinc protease
MTARRWAFAVLLACGVATMPLSTSLALADPGVKADGTLLSDPRLVTGELENGVKYIIRKHANPPGRASVWMHMGTGSLNETDKQRGIAHYLEHMAFNGSENFPPGSVIPFFESLGLTFGQHQNAYTSFDETVYQLSLPDTKVETLDKALTFMSDVATKLSLIPAEIEKERQVIQEERRSGLGAQQRIRDIVFKRIAPGSTFGERIPIGVEETINSVQQQDFKDYYGTYYSLSNAIVIALGDIEETVAVERIKAKFGGGAKKPVPANKPVGVKAADKPAAVVVQDKELTQGAVAIIRVAPARPAATTKDLVRRDITELLANAVFDRRLEAKVNAGSVAFQRAGAGVSPLFQAMVLSQAQAGGEPTQWEPMLRDMAKEIARARKFGFTEQELDEVKKEALASGEQRAAQEATYPAGAILGTINSAIEQGEPVRAPAQDLDLMKELLPTIHASDISAAFAASFDPTGFVYVVELPEAIKAPSEEELLKIGVEAMSAEVKEETKSKSAEKLLDEMPTGGTIGESSEHAASQIGSAWLSNGVLVHHKFMDVQKDSLSVVIALAGGTMLESAESRGVTSAAIEAWQRPATSKRTSTDIRDLMTGKKISVSGAGGMDSIRLVVSGSPSDLEDGLQLAYLLLTDPKIEDAAFTQWHTRQLQAIEQQDKDPRGFFSKLLYNTVYPADAAKVQPTTKEQVEKITIAQAQAWITRLVAECPIEVSIVGDIQREKAMELVAKYIGSIKTRERISSSLYAKERTLKRPEGARIGEREMETQTPLAVVLGGFYGPDATDTPNVRRMSMAERIISTRMNKQLREDEQLVYSIGASTYPGWPYQGFGMFFAAAPTQPEKVGKLVERIEQMLTEFGEKGITSEELDVAKKQAHNALDEQVKEPSYWSGVMDLMTLQQTKLDDVVGESGAIDAMTADDVMQSFRSFHKPENRISVVVKPKAKAEGKTDDKPEVGVEVKKEPGEKK